MMCLSVWGLLPTIASSVLLCLAAAARANLAADESSDGQAPNFVIILADDQGYGDLGCHGSKTIKTPRLDRMAAEGMKFTSFYMAAACCTPSRAALLTGCYPQRVGLPTVLFPNSMPRGQADGKAIGLNPDEITIAELLKTRGYITACIGKWHLGERPEFLPTRQGFDEYFGLPYSNDMHSHNTKYKFPPLPLMRNEQIVETEPDQDFLTTRYTKEAVRFIAKNKDRPFFIYLAHSMPHRPVHVSEPFRGRFTKEQLDSIRGEDKQSRDFLYPAAIEEIDSSTGQILDALKQNGLDEKTLVLFTSDNGPSRGSAGPLRGGKGSMFEGGMRVPCIVRWVGKIPAGEVCDRLVTAMDVLPTFAALAGAEVPADRVIDGRDIRPLLTARPEAGPPQETFFYFDQDRGLTAVRGGKWKLFVKTHGRGNSRTPAGSLYDLEADIGEKHNIAADHPQVVRRLRLSARQFAEELSKTSRPVGKVPLPDRRPNILWIVTDDHRPDTLGSTGLPWLKTPNIDRIASRGVLFRHAFCQGPICTPSRCSMITGRYCHSVGVMSNKQSLGTDAPYLTRPLQAAGYQLINVGKKLPSPKIFDVQIRAPGYGGPGATPFKLKPPFAGREEEFGVLHLNEVLPVIIAGRYPLPAGQTEPAIVISRAIRLVEKGLKSPFVLRVSIIAPHTPILPPKPFDTMYDPDKIPFQPPTDKELAGKPRWEREKLRKHQGSTHLSRKAVQRARACYAGLVSHVDDQIGRLLAVMKRQGLLDDTLVVVTSDQGVLLGEHGLFMKRNFYEQSAGAILIVSWPGHLPQGKVIDDLVELIDVMPTILDAAGVNVPATAQGRSLLPLIAGREKGRDAVFCEIDFSKPQFQSCYMPNSRRVMVRTREWKMSYFINRTGDARDGDLYHLTEDPNELHNLWADKAYANVVTRLEARVKQWNDKTQP